MQQKIRFQIEGMTCQACASRIEKVLNKKDFVESAGVNFASEEAQVTFDDSKTSIADIIAIIQKTGYGAQEKTEELPQTAPEAHIGWRLWLLFAINIPFLIGMAGMLVGRTGQHRYRRYLRLFHRHALLCPARRTWSRTRRTNLLRGRGDGYRLCLARQIPRTPRQKK